ncbi:hypothetical protein ACSVIJ_04625 [Pseudomonas sp. NCHU5208]|uniref:hypothetical protein n=1 Tax=unclassified Pseudomonas TaxID=196821 RepID=UPI003F9E5A89
MSLKRLFITAACALLLSGCGSEEHAERIDTFTALVDEGNSLIQLVGEFREQAAGTDDFSAAHEALSQAIVRSEHWRRKLEGPLFAGVSPQAMAPLKNVAISLQEQVDAAAEQRTALVVDSAKAGNEQALVHLFGDTSPRGLFEFDLDRSREVVAPVLLQLAQKPGASAQVLYLAGSLALEGKFVQQDFGLASAALEQAWSTGSLAAPAKLAQIYLATGDAQNAYLWAIRCVSPCENEPKLDGYLKQVKPGEILSVQEHANDKAFLRF